MIGERIAARSAEMGVQMPEGAAGQFQTYFEMLTEANRVMNLCRGLEDESEAADRHFVDSLTLLKAAELPTSARVIDVGSGAGFPGLPLAIARPDLDITLLDSLGKRVTFLQSVIDRLGLRARAIHARCEDVGRDAAHRERYDMATARAVAALPTLAEWLSPFVRPGGMAAVLKGPSLDEEMAASANALRQTRLQAGRTVCISPPGRDWDHRILILQKTGALPAKYPRKSGEAVRRPL